jgi:hypothetical protein
MKKLPIKQLPDAFINWSNTIEDFWLGKFIHSTGYTKKEIYELTKKNKKLDYAVKYAVESLFEKAFYKVLAGEIKISTVGFLMTYWGQVFKIIKPCDYSKYQVTIAGKNDFSGLLDNYEDDNRDSKNEFEGEIQPLIEFVKK